MLYIGPHVSAAGSVALSVERASELGATGFAIFTKNQRQWKAKPLDESDAASFIASLSNLGFNSKAILPHAGYLINPATPDEELREKSLNLFKDEVSRCIMLGLNVINIHPGAFKEGLRSDGIRRSAKMVDQVLDEFPEFRIAIENTAGAGTVIGSSFEDLEELLENIKNKDRVGFTLDTAHLFGAGYDVKSDPYGILDFFFSKFGSNKLFGMHLNDSKVPLASNKDRHDSLGLGLIGKEAFIEIVKRKEVDNIPLILETPDESRWSSEIKELLDAGKR